MLLLATATYVVSFAAWTLLGALAPLYREALGLSAMQTGWLVAVPVVVGALGRVPAGILADSETWARRCRRGWPRDVSGGNSGLTGLNWPA